MSDMQPVVKESEKALIQAKGFHINTDDDYQWAIAMAKAFKELEKKVTDTFEPVRKKAYETYQLAQKQKKDYLEPIQEAQALLRRKMGAFQTLKEQQRAEEEALLRAEAKTQGLDESLVVLPPKEKDEGVSYREVWEWKVTSFQQVPDEYKQLDEGKIGKAVRALKDRHGIPGIQAIMRKTAVIR